MLQSPPVKPGGAASWAVLMVKKRSKEMSGLGVKLVGGTTGGWWSLWASTKLAVMQIRKRRHDCLKIGLLDIAGSGNP